MKQKIKEKWAQMDPKQKKAVVYAGIAALVVFLFCIVFYVLFFSQMKTRPHNVRAYDRKISLEPEMIEKSLYAQTQKKLAEAAKTIENLQKEIEQLKKGKEKKEDETTLLSQPPQKEEESEEQKTPQYITLPSPPPSPEQVRRQMNYTPYPPPPPEKGTEKKEPSYIGGIGIVRGEEVEKKKTEKEGKNKREESKNTIYLPSGSFMKATLLTGVDAEAVMGGKSEPRPVLLRIKDLAILPNRIKSDLKGCFVTGAAEGKLNDERVHIVLERLSCIAKNGHAVIDQKVDGYVVDEDGKVGLKGYVAAPKLGTNIARSALAGFFGGVGEAVQMSSMNLQTTALGTQQQLFTSTDAKNIARAGIGGGISAAADDVRKFYLQLAQQSMPVVEVGASKTVTVVIKKGVNLEIKNYKTNFEKEGENGEI